MCLSDQEYCRAWKWGLWPQCIHLHPSIISLYALDSVHTLPPSSAPPGPRDHIHIQTANWQGTVGLQGAHSRWVLLPEPLLDVQKEMGPRGCKGGIVKMRFTHSHTHSGIHALFCDCMLEAVYVYYSACCDSLWTAWTAFCHVLSRSAVRKMLRR